MSEVEDDEGRWPLAQRAASALVVIAAVTVLLFTVGFLYDVFAQTPASRTELPGKAVVAPSSVPGGTGGSGNG